MDSLPNELKRVIASNLGARDTASLSETSKATHELFEAKVALNSERAQLLEFYNHNSTSELIDELEHFSSELREGFCNKTIDEIWEKGSQLKGELKQKRENAFNHLLLHKKISEDEYAHISVPCLIKESIIQLECILLESTLNGGKTLDGTVLDSFDKFCLTHSYVHERGAKLGHDSPIMRKESHNEPVAALFTSKPAKMSQYVTDRHKTERDFFILVDEYRVNERSMDSFLKRNRNT